MKAKLLLAGLGVFIISAGAVAWSKLNTEENAQNAGLVEVGPTEASADNSEASADAPKIAVSTESASVSETKAVPSLEQVDVANADDVVRSREIEDGSAISSVDVAGNVPQQANDAVPDEARTVVSAGLNLVDMTSLAKAAPSDVESDTQPLEIVVAGVEVRESEVDVTAEIDELKQSPRPEQAELDAESLPGANEATVGIAGESEELVALRLEIERLRAELDVERAGALAMDQAVSGEEAVAAMKPTTGSEAELTRASQTIGPDSTGAGDPLAALGAAALPLTLTEVHFDIGKSDITAGAQRKTMEVLGLLERLDSPIIRIEGYSDTTGSPERNKILSENRALAVRSIMVELGYDPAKVEIQAMGETNLPEPTADGISEPYNRCVGIVLVGYEKG